MTSYVEVAFPIPLNRTFHYHVSGGTVQTEQSNAPFGPSPIGQRVLAPFGKKGSLVGYVIGLTNEKPSFATKSIQAFLDPEPFIDEKLLELARWLADRYLCSLGEALACIAPPALTAPKRQRVSEEESRRVSESASVTHSPTRSLAYSLKLSVEQKHVLEKLLAAVDAKRFEPFLLRGITDSGKTELYLRCIDHVLAKSRQAIFLLPEIALTPPFIQKLTARYSSERVGLWHSGVTPNERYRTWRGVRDGTIRVLLGARSAVFAPFPDLGLIVLDEEHEPSYKQEDRPRYHTREVALKRAEQTKAVLIMGSATPSLESYWKAKQGMYTLLELTSRVEQKSLPPVTLIDRRPKQLGSDPKRRGSDPFTVFSEPLRLAIEQRLARREQMMLFVNRRGFTPFLRCSKCGWVARCPRCSTTLALHLGSDPSANKGSDPGRYLQCHACLYREKVTIQCPACKSMRLHQFGIGTQRVEEEMRKLFPFVKLARLDQDAASSRKVFEKIYNAFAGGELDVLVGTQMIAKGFDFPKVTLVGVVDADVSLHLPDFRSAERTFQLIAQVAGRTGRGESRGQVLVQTHHPDHYAPQAAQLHDYLRFYEEEIGYREKLGYPPFLSLIHVLVRGNKETVVQNSAELLADKLTVLGSDVSILGPAPAPYSRLRKQYRYQIVLKGTEKALAPFRQFLHHYRLPKAFMSVDVDPMDLL